MKKLIILTILMTIPLISFCNKEANRFNYYEVDSVKANARIDQYFKGKKYSVIMAHKVGFNGEKIYFAIEEFKQIKLGFKRGIFVKESGEIEGIIEPDKGVFIGKRKIVDFDRMGFDKSEVGCFSFKNYDDKMYNRVEKAIVNAFFILIFDKDYQEMEKMDFFLDIHKPNDRYGSLLSLSAANPDDIENFYKNAPKFLQEHREKKNKVGK